MSSYPGAIFITPPEGRATTYGSPTYGPSFDMYSYGVIMGACILWAGTNETAWSQGEDMVVNPSYKGRYVCVYLPLCG